FFLFQAEDGIRDRNVTGVQTCALPIYEVFQVSEPFDRAETMRNYFVMNSVETAAMMKDIEQASGQPVTFSDVEPLTWAIYRAGLDRKSVVQGKKQDLGGGSVVEERA